MINLLFSQPIVAAGAQPNQWAIFMHGLFGSGNDWKGVATRVVAERPEWGVELVDLRLHGNSRGFHSPHTIESCARDIHRLVNKKFGTAAQVLLGHSLGGKLALVAGAAHEGFRQVWSVDSSPGPTFFKGMGWRIISALRVLPEFFTTREEAIEELIKCGLGKKTACWVAANLQSSGTGFSWQWALEDLISLRQDYVALNLWDVIENPPRENLEIHLIQAEESRVINKTAAARIKRAAGRHKNIFFHSIAGVHAVHVKNQGGIVKLLASSLPF